MPLPDRLDPWNEHSRAPWNDHSYYGDGRHGVRGGSLNGRTGQPRRRDARTEPLIHALSDLLDDTGLGVIQLCRHRRIIGANPRAAKILRAADGLRNRGGVLHATVKAEQVVLDELLAAAIPNNESKAASGSMTITRWPSERLSIHICPTRRRVGAVVRPRVAAIVLVVDPTTHWPIDPERVSDALGLTPAEGRVAVALAKGLAVREIAAATQRAESTVRWTIKRIYAKLNITRQADLVRMVFNAGTLVLPLG